MGLGDILLQRQKCCGVGLALRIEAMPQFASLLRTGGNCVVASAAACVDVFSDFVRLRGRVGTGVAATAAVASD